MTLPSRFGIVAAVLIVVLVLVRLDIMRDPRTTAKPVLARAAVALGPRRQSAGMIRVRGTVRSNGVASAYTYIADLRHGYDRTTVTTFAEGTDANGSWSTRGGKSVSIPDADEIGRARSYLIRAGYARPDADGARLDFVMKSGDTEQVRLHPAQVSKPIDLVFDANTGLLVRYRDGDDRVFLSKYRTVDGIAYPFRIDRSNGTEARTFVARNVMVVNGTPAPAELMRSR